MNYHPLIILTALIKTDTAINVRNDSGGANIIQNESKQCYFISVLTARIARKTGGLSKLCHGLFLASVTILLERKKAILRTHVALGNAKYLRANLNCVIIIVINGFLYACRNRKREMVIKLVISVEIP